MVVMDLIMPGMDGIQTLYGIKSRHPALPMILQSSHSGYKNNYLCWAADDFVIKSANTTPLKLALRKLLEEPAPFKS